MIKFYSQPNYFACGPFAILNVLKWCEQKVNFRDWKRIAEICGTEKVGTDDTNFEKALYNLVGDFLVIKKRVRFTTKELTKHLRQGGIIILRMSKDHNGEELHHYCLVTKSEPYKFVLVNYLEGKVFFSLPKRTFKKLEPYFIYCLKKKKRSSKCSEKLLKKIK